MLWMWAVLGTGLPRSVLSHFMQIKSGLARPRGTEMDVPGSGGGPSLSGGGAPFVGGSSSITSSSSVAPSTASVVGAGGGAFSLSSALASAAAGLREFRWRPLVCRDPSVNQADTGYGVVPRTVLFNSLTTLLQYLKFIQPRLNVLRVPFSAVFLLLCCDANVETGRILSPTPP